MERVVYIYTYTADDINKGQGPSKLVSQHTVGKEWDGHEPSEIIEHYLHDYCIYQARDIYSEILEPEAFWDEVRYQREWVEGRMIEYDKNCVETLLK